MKNLLTASLLIIAVILLLTQTKADMFKWVDKDGVTHFGDAPSTSVQHVETIKTPDYPAPSPWPQEPQNDTTPTPKQKSVYNKKNDANEVEIYTTSWCGYCTKATAFLRSHGIEFVKYDIEKDPKAAAKMKALGGRGGVPFAIINGEQVYGFSAKTYKRVLGLQ